MSIAFTSESCHFQGKNVLSGVFQRVVWGVLTCCVGGFDVLTGLFDTLKLPPRGELVLQVTDYQEGRNAKGVKRDNWDKRHPIFFPLLPSRRGGGIFSKQLV